MFTIGKRRKREPLTDEQRAAFAAIRQAAKTLNMQQDELAQIFGHKTFNALQASNNSGENTTEKEKRRRRIKHPQGQQQTEKITITKKKKKNTAFLANY